MEIYIYGTFREVTMAKLLLQREFTFMGSALPVFDLPVIPEQDFCRIHVRDDQEGG